MFTLSFTLVCCLLSASREGAAKHAERQDYYFENVDPVPYQQLAQQQYPPLLPYGQPPYQQEQFGPPTFEQPTFQYPPYHPLLNQFQFEPKRYGSHHSIPAIHGQYMRRSQVRELEPFDLQAPPPLLNRTHLETESHDTDQTPETPTSRRNRGNIKHIHKHHIQ
ncbi:hypothetical protein GE061_008118, partial [Apolygus lucorum]